VRNVSLRAIRRRKTLFFRGNVIITIIVAVFQNLVPQDIYKDFPYKGFVCEVRIRKSRSFVNISRCQAFLNRA
jgi:hypothetical protein